MERKWIGRDKRQRSLNSGAVLTLLMACAFSVTNCAPPGLNQSDIVSGTSTDALYSANVSCESGLESDIFCSVEIDTCSETEVVVYYNENDEECDCDNPDENCEIALNTTIDADEDTTGENACVDTVDVTLEGISENTSVTVTACPTAQANDSSGTVVEETNENEGGSGSNGSGGSSGGGNSGNSGAGFNNGGFSGGNSVGSLAFSTSTSTDSSLDRAVELSISLPNRNGVTRYSQLVAFGELGTSAPSSCSSSVNHTYTINGPFAAAQVIVQDDEWSGTVNGQAVSYRLCAVRNGRYISVGTSTNVETSDYIPPPGITNVNAATGSTSGEIDLTWDEAFAPSSEDDQYTLVIRYNTGGTAPTDCSDSAMEIYITDSNTLNSTMSYTVENLASNTTYAFSLFTDDGGSSTNNCVTSASNMDSGASAGGSMNFGGGML